jgi:hypothetical protein
MCYNTPIPTKESDYIMQTMGNLFDEVEADLLNQYRAITPKQFEIEEHRRKLQREYEASITSIETDEDRSNTEDYPVDEDEQ